MARATERCSQGRPDEALACDSEPNHLTKADQNCGARCGAAFHRMWKVLDVSATYARNTETSRSAYLNDAFKRQERLPLSNHRLSSSNLTRET